MVNKIRRKKNSYNVYAKILRRYQKPKKNISKQAGFFSQLKMLTSPLIVANCVLFRDFRYSL